MSPHASSNRLPRSFGHDPTLPLFLHIGKGSIVANRRLQLSVAVFSLYALFIYALDTAGALPAFGRNAGSLSAVLSMVTGLMVSFRSGSSSDRWHEGRRIWSNVQMEIRTLLRTLVLSLPLDDQVQRADKGRDGQREVQNEAVEDVMKLTVGFSYALKHHLRDEPGIGFSDLSILPKSFIATLSAASPRSSSLAKSDSGRTVAAMNDDSTSSLKSRARPPSAITTNLPLTILKQLHVALNAFHTSVGASAGAPGEQSPALETATWANCLQILKELTGDLTQAERIRDTPIPAALGIHIQQMLILHLLTIPPQLVGTLGIFVIPVAALTAFTFFGVDRIAEELSDPFGLEPNDLPLDRFCADIRREYLELLGRNEPDSGAVGTSDNDNGDWERVGVPQVSGSGQIKRE